MVCTTSSLSPTMTPGIGVGTESGPIVMYLGSDEVSSPLPLRAITTISYVSPGSKSVTFNQLCSPSGSVSSHSVSSSPFFLYLMMYSLPGFSAGSLSDGVHDTFTNVSPVSKSARIGASGAVATLVLSSVKYSVPGPILVLAQIYSTYCVSSSNHEFSYTWQMGCL